ncbi:hypothetical protein IWQ56_007519, partial [Coemansia nantahalensis]
CIPRFGGDVTKQPLEQWLERLECTLDVVNLPETQWARIVPYVFGDGVLTQVTTGAGFKKGFIPTWAAVRTYLEVSFGRVSTAYDKVTDFDVLRCGDDVGSFNSTFLRLARNLKYADDEILRAWYLRKLPPALRMDVQSLNLQSLNRMQEQAVFFTKVRRDMQEQSAADDDMRMDIDRVEAKSKPKQLPRQQWLDDYAPFVARERFKKNVRDG